MDLNKGSLRERFDAMRRAMRWSWKDIDMLTGRKNARTNIAKRVPVWSTLAIHAHEGYEVLLRHHIVSLLSLHLGQSWSLKKLSYGQLYFIHDGSRGKKVAGIDLDFYDGGFILSSDSSILYELAEKLKSLYPAMGHIVSDGEKFTLDVPIVFDPEPEHTIKTISERKEPNW